jgi:hypothetical protein
MQFSFQNSIFTPKLDDCVDSGGQVKPEILTNLGHSSGLTLNWFTMEYLLSLYIWLPLLIWVVMSALFLVQSYIPLTHYAHCKHKSLD